MMTVWNSGTNDFILLLKIYREYNGVQLNSTTGTGVYPYIPPLAGEIEEQYFFLPYDLLPIDALDCIFFELPGYRFLKNGTRSKPLNLKRSNGKIRCFLQ